MSKRGWILIDGYNLLHASGVFGEGGRTPLEGAREALLSWLARTLPAGQRQRTTIVFDARQAPPGLPRVAHRDGITVRFAPRGSEADDLLEELIQAHSSPRRLTVVSSDHRLHRAARRRKARPIDSADWVGRQRTVSSTPEPRSGGLKTTVSAEEDSPAPSDEAADAEDRARGNPSPEVAPSPERFALLEPHELEELMGGVPPTARDSNDSDTSSGM